MYEESRVKVEVLQVWGLSTRDTEVAFKLECNLGDKSGGKNFFLRGIQGEVSRPVWNRDYFYLNGLVQQVGALTNIVGFQMKFFSLMQCCVSNNI